MGTPNKKPSLKRSMRVATLFTGAAAATVGLTQTAHAADVAGPTHKPTTKHMRTQAVRPAVKYKTGSIQSSAYCADQQTHESWLHAYYYRQSYQESSAYCYGYKGTVSSPGGTGVTWECGGTNHGELFGYSDDGTKAWSFHYKPGTTYAHLDRASLDFVSISGWTGTDKCAPTPP